MNRWSLLILFLGMIVEFSAQNLGNDVIYFDDLPQKKITFSGFGNAGSSVLDKETMSLFYNGGFFDESLKAESLKRLGNTNVFGGEYNFQLSYSDPKAKVLDDYGYYLNVELGGGAGVNFTKDLFELVFVGNKSFVGDSAVLTNTQMAQYQYKKIGIGLNDNDKIKVGLALMAFDNYAYGKVNEGILSIDPNADSMNLSLNTNYMTNRKQGKQGAIGYGVGFDFEMNLPYNNTSDSLKTPRLVLGFRNVGLFFSTKTMKKYDLDTTYRYHGFEVNGLNGFQQSLFTAGQLQDSLVPIADTGRVFRMLPFEFYFYSPSNPNGKKLQLIYGMRYRYGVAMLPMVYFGGDWRPSKTTIVSAYLNFGGYSFIKTGLSVRKELGNVRVGVAFNNLPGFFTREAYNYSAAISMSYVIK